MIMLVTGASGNIGSRIAQLLTQQGIHPRRLVRDPAKAPKLESSPLAVGDYADRAALDAAMQGIEIVFLTSAGAAPLARAKLHGNVIDAAAAAGVKRIVYLSFQAASATSPFAYSADHLLTEAHLKQSGVAWTILRDSFYLDLLPTLADAAGIIRSPDEDGRTAWVSREDVARSATAALIGAHHAGQTYTLTGPEALSLREATVRLSAIAGGRFKYKKETLDEGKAWRTATGAAAWEVDVWLGSYLAMGSGELAEVSNAVESLTGRAPFSLKTYFEKHPSLLEHGSTDAT